MFQRGLRYFLLSESGSLEAKIAITMSILSFCKTIQQNLKIFIEHERARQQFYQQNSFPFGYGNNNFESFFDRFEHERERQRESNRIMNENEGFARDLFGFPEDFTESELKKRYRELQREWHPDKNLQRPDEATEMSQKINLYKDILYEKIRQ